VVESERERGKRSSCCLWAVTISSSTERRRYARLVEDICRMQGPHWCSRARIRIEELRSAHLLGAGGTQIPHLPMTATPAGRTMFSRAYTCTAVKITHSLCSIFAGSMNIWTLSSPTDGRAVASAPSYSTARWSDLTVLVEHLNTRSPLLRIGCPITTLSNRRYGGSSCATKYTVCGPEQLERAAFLHSQHDTGGCD
jgi:hypothetical protein